MKFRNGFIVVAAIFAINNAMAMLPQGVSMQSNYGRFLIGFNRPVITSNNMVNMDWVKGALLALQDDGILGDLTNNTVANNIATMLWYAIEDTVNYNANLPQNRNNPDFRTRIWESLTRSIDEVRRSQPPTRPLPQTPQSTRPARPVSPAPQIQRPARPTSPAPKVAVPVRVLSQP